MKKLMTTKTVNRTSTTRRALARSALALAAAACIAPAALAQSPAPSASPAWCADRCDQVVLHWNVVAWRTLNEANGYADPMAASRVLAMVHLAMHAAVNTVQPRYRRFAETAAAAQPQADAAVAAMTAAHGVLAALHPRSKAALDSELAAALLDAGKGAAIDAGREVGAKAAAAVLARRDGDGADKPEPYTVRNEPGQWRFTPGFDFIAAPHWRKVTPFALRSPEQFRVKAPPALASREYAEAFNEVKESGGTTSAKRTPDQAQYAAFWYEFSYIGWNRIARVVSGQVRQDLWDRARTFALLNVGMADAYIAGWDSKLHYNFWRPVTAIREAANDNNPATAADAAWTPLLPTPPIQDHPSTHSALGAAAAVVLAHAFGNDRIAFRFASPSAPAGQPMRSFSSFSQAAEENADSRVRAGIHFRFATREGLELGRRIGAYAVGNLLQPAN